MSPSNSHGSEFKQRWNGPWLAHPLPAIASARPSDEDVATRAYERFLSRGSVHGLDREDWAQATQELIAEAFARDRSLSSRAEASAREESP
jgi:hypothetical protein